MVHPVLSMLVSYRILDPRQSECIAPGLQGFNAYWAENMRATVMDPAHHCGKNSLIDIRKYF
jgi:hypothetical protein